MNEQPRFTITSLNRMPLPEFSYALITRPNPGALGALEPLALQLALIQGGVRSVLSGPSCWCLPRIMVSLNKRVSIAPPEVTGQMVRNFFPGGPQLLLPYRRYEVEVIDAGILAAIDDPRLTVQAIGCRNG